MSRAACVNLAKALGNKVAGSMGVSFSPGDACAGFFSERGLPMKKTIALSLVIAASLGLSACSKKADEVANNAANMAENASNAAENSMNAAMNAADNATNTAANMANAATNAM